MELREVELRASDEGTVEGIAVPWDQVVTIAGVYREKIARGAVEDGDIKFFWQHNQVIGKVIAKEDRDEGLYIKAKISDTQAGRDALTLLRDDVVDRFSIGFEPIEEHKDADGVVVRTKIRVREVSAVNFPAYDGAKVATVRGDESGPQVATEKKGASVSETLTAADLNEVRDSISDLEREFKLQIDAVKPVEEPGDQFRSYGDYVKALAAGNETAKRAYAGAVVGDAVIKDAWIGNLVKLGTQKQTVLNAFSRGPLPADGMGVEYAVLKSDTTQVGVQADEGDDLLFGKVSIETERADIVTLGGWSSLSRQAIERANVGILDTTFRALYLKYTRAVETLTRQAVTAALVGADSVEGDLTTQDGIVALIMDLAEHFDEGDLALNGIFVDSATFRSIYAVEASDRILQVSNAGTDKVGSLTVNLPQADLAGISVNLYPGATAGTVFAYDSSAIKTLESPGAPLRLQDENIVNLTKDFSVYGYATSFAQVPAGIVKVVDGE